MSSFMSGLCEVYEVVGLLFFCGSQCSFGSVRNW